MKRKRLYLHAMSILDRLYEYPNHLSDNEKQIIYKEYLKLIRRAAYAKNPDAQYELGQHYEDIGFSGIPNPYKNVYKRFYWYSKAASNNHASACNNLATHYEQGLGCERNIDTALNLYKKGWSLGDDLAKKNYKLLLKQINSEKVNKKE